MKYDILVNKEHPIGPDYCPPNLVDTNSRVIDFVDKDYHPLLNEEAFKAFQLMRMDAAKLGYDIEVDSGYRSYAYQQSLFNYFLNEKGEEAYKVAALPGTSEHHTGLALDFCLYINGQYTDDITDEQVETKWIHENCYKYGFILRYPKGKENITGYNYEPWHLRYVGLEMARDITMSNLTLEEYLDYINKRTIK